jgi:hypothetical protein
MAFPTLAEIRAWIQVPVSALSDAQLQQIVDSEAALQAAECTIPELPADYPDELNQAMLRRVAHVAALRSLPLGIISDVESAPMQAAAWDSEVRRLEGPWRSVVVA